MRVTKITLTDYRAFYGAHEFDLSKSGKNLLLYGENGSGKSSLFTALQTFFRAALDKHEFEPNRFVSEKRKAEASIKLYLKESESSSKTTKFTLDAHKGFIESEDKAVLENAAKIQGMLDYRLLLRTHLLEDREQTLNLFELLLQDVFYHQINRTTTKPFGESYQEITNAVKGSRQGVNIRERVSGLVEGFNNGFAVLLNELEKETNTILAYFYQDTQVKFIFNGLVYGGNKGALGPAKVHITATFKGQQIPKHQRFLNEARLSALAISLFLASIRKHPSKGVLKLLVLDDLLIGLDMSNRVPLLRILRELFLEVKEQDRFQVIMTTYDRAWFEVVQSEFGNKEWEYKELYSKRLNEELPFEIPILLSNEGYLEKAKQYLEAKDYKASAVYLRSEFERQLQEICNKHRLPVAYHKRSKDLTTEAYWTAIKTYTNIAPATIEAIERHRGTVMNPFSHHDLEKPAFEAELKATIEVIENLRPDTISRYDPNYKAEIEKLRTEIQKKDAIIRTLNRKLQENGASEAENEAAV